MKKLVMIFAFVASMGIGLNAGNLSDEEFDELVNDCLDNENKDSCQRLIDNDSLVSVDKCKDSNSCFYTAKVYYIAENYHQAVPYCKKDCETFNGSSSCFNLALMYENGKGIRQDYAKAKAYYEKGCNLNNAEACVNLGGLYFEGQGVRQNKSTAKKYAGKACDLGDQDGCNNYKILNEQGIQ